ncbi:DUF6676 family protein [Mycobacterium sp.]|uniref:Rv1476 family membrane protein n=1 Tax=Mycobacterium sp. TaxID=1785 RepID=UPI0031D1E21F
MCSTIGADPATPPDQCLAVVRQQVDADAVSAPPAVIPGLLNVVDQARDHGIDLKVVVLDRNPPNDPPLRDVATVVGSDHPDATVLVLSPSFVGSYSTHFPRSTLEIGEDHAKTGDPVVSAQNFLRELDTPQFPWTAITIVLLIGVFAAAVGARLLQTRAAGSATSGSAVDTAARGTE